MESAGALNSVQHVQSGQALHGLTGHSGLVECLEQTANVARSQALLDTPPHAPEPPDEFGTFFGPVHIKASRLKACSQPLISEKSLHSSSSSVSARFHSLAPAPALRPP